MGFIVGFTALDYDQISLWSWKLSCVSSTVIVTTTSIVTFHRHRDDDDDDDDDDDHHHHHHHHYYYYIMFITIIIIVIIVIIIIVIVSIIIIVTIWLLSSVFIPRIYCPTAITQDEAKAMLRNLRQRGGAPAPRQWRRKRRTTPGAMVAAGCVGGSRKAWWVATRCVSNSAPNAHFSQT